MAELLADDPKAIEKFSVLHFVMKPEQFGGKTVWMLWFQYVFYR